MWSFLEECTRGLWYYLAKSSASHVSYRCSDAGIGAESLNASPGLSQERILLVLREV